MKQEFREYPQHEQVGVTEGMRAAHYQATGVIASDDEVYQWYKWNLNNDLNAIKKLSNEINIGRAREAYNNESKVERVQQDRLKDYGDPSISHGSIATFWSEYLSRKLKQDIKLDDVDAAIMMSLMKVSRIAFSRTDDNFIDYASYADLALSMFDKEKDI